jgi:outer membrane protein assembly factor BamB
VARAARERRVERAETPDPLDRHRQGRLESADRRFGHFDADRERLYRDLLILLCDHPSASYVLAVDKRTGKDRWKADRGKGRSSYSTPLVVEGASGAELIVNSTERIDAYDAVTGRPLWYTGEANRFPIPSPVVHEGVIYASRGYRSGPYMAIRPGGSGDVSGTHVVWRVPTGAPYVTSLLYYDGAVYMANDVGVLRRRCPDRRSALAAARGRRVFSVSGCRRWPRLFRQ